jgi:hypothetical protein
MTRSIVLAGALALCAAGGAAAQGGCPAGLARDGVWFEFPDRSVLSRVLSDGRISETEFGYEDAYIYGYVTLPIGLIVEGWGFENGRAIPTQREDVTYAGTPDPVPTPSPGVRFDGIETTRFHDGTSSRYSVSAVVGQPQAVTIGGCAYTGLPVNVTRVEMPGGAVQMDAMVHLTELGVTIYLGYSDTGAPPDPTWPVAVSMGPPVAGGGPSQPPPLPDPPAGGTPPQK